MKHLLLIILLCIAVAVSGTAAWNQVVLQELDLNVEHRQQYIEKKELNLQHLKELYEHSKGQTQYDLCVEIYNIYNGLNTDSAMRYSRLCYEHAQRLQNPVLEQQAQIFLSQCLSINCMFEQARDLLEPMREKITESNICAYYKACNSLCVWEADFSTIPEQQNEDQRKTIEYRHLILTVETNPIWRAQEEALIQAETDPRLALEILLPVFRDLPQGDDHIRYLANSLGSFFSRLNQPDSALHYYALSAISDLQHGIMEHASLREVALILFREGDIERAYRYMNCCIQDAQLCKARLRTIEMAGDMPVILEAYQRKIHGQQQRLRWNIVVLF